MMNFKVNIIFIILLFFIGCVAEEKETRETKPSPKIVKVQNLQQINIKNNTKEYPAQIKPFKNEVLAFEVPGKIEKFYFKLGEFVKKGDTIATLNNDIYKANYSAALSSYKKAKSDFKRAKNLFDKGAISKTNYELNTQGFDVARSKYNVAKKNLDNSKLIAHFDGVLANKLVEDYAVVAPNQSIALLQDKSFLKAEFYIPQTDIIQTKALPTMKDINTKYNFSVQISDKTNTLFSAKLSDFSTSAEAVTRTYKAVVVMEDPKEVNILPGMTAKVIATKKQNDKKRVFVPSSSLFSDHTKNTYVWTVQENKVKKAHIQTGTLIKDMVEVIEGLSGSEVVVTSGVNLLRDDEVIKIYKKMSN